MSLAVTPVTIWMMRVIAYYSQSPWLKIQPPLRWFPLLKCLRASQSLAWALSEHLGKRLAREPPSSWRPYGHRDSPAGKASHPLPLPTSPLQSLPAPLLPDPRAPLLLCPPHFPTLPRIIISSAFFVPFFLVTSLMSSFSTLPAPGRVFPSLACQSDGFLRVSSKPFLAERCAWTSHPEASLQLPDQLVSPGEGHSLTHSPNSPRPAPGHTLRPRHSNEWEGASAPEDLSLLRGQLKPRVEERY